MSPQSPVTGMWRVWPYPDTEIPGLNLVLFHRHTLFHLRIPPSDVLTSNRETLLSSELPSPCRSKPFSPLLLPQQHSIEKNEPGNPLISFTFPQKTNPGNILRQPGDYLREPADYLRPASQQNPISEKRTREVPDFAHVCQKDNPTGHPPDTRRTPEIHPRDT